MTDTREYIVTKSFEVFLTKGYDSTSMTVLQNELKISRGAMYRYFTSKENLFKAVMDRYLFGLLDYVRPQMNENMTILECIEAYYENVEKACKHLDNVEGFDIIFLNFTALTIQAAKHYPGFLDRWKLHKTNELRSWQVILENSIKKGEIRADINVNTMAQVFMKAINLNDMDSNIKSYTGTAKATKKMMNYVYSLIKV